MGTTSSSGVYASIPPCSQTRRKSRGVQVSGLLVKFTPKAGRLDYPLHQRYDVVKGQTADLDAIRMATTDTHGDVFPDLSDGRRIGLIVLSCDNLITQFLKVHLLPPEEFNMVSSSFYILDVNDWVTWLDKAINENLQAKIKVPKDKIASSHQ